ncbi:MAG: hypothetical protein RMM31_08950 [Anaerolineae bacterium]|nr:hypothetical protein [Thermoflexales bacterium]MDW8396356.1 hypothetical protein [Anaerolineae bacterium]
MSASIRFLASLAVMLMLGACSFGQGSRPRVELPQELRLPQSDFAAIFEPRVGRIAVVTEEGNILITDQTGREQLALTEDGGQVNEQKQAALYSLPVWSPNGKELAFVRRVVQRESGETVIEVNPRSVAIQRGPESSVIEQGEEGSRVRRPGEGVHVENAPARVIIQRGSGDGGLISSAVYIASADGKRPLREVFYSESLDVTYLDWSPDGSQLAISASDRRGSRTVLNLVAPRDGAKPKTVLEGAAITWHWNPDGRALLARLTPRSGRADQLALFELDTQTETRIPTQGGLAFLSPAFSPDGGFMLLTERTSEGQRLVLADRSGKPVRTLTRFNGLARFAWSPAGAKVAYVAQESLEGGVLRLLDVNSGENRLLVNRPVVAFFWSPDGERIAVFSTASADEVPENFKGFAIIPPMPTEIYLLEVVDPSTGQSRPLFYFAPTAAFQRLVNEFDRYSRAVTPWAPDGRKLVFTLTFGNAASARDFVIETEASGSVDPRVLGNGSLAFWSPR